MKIQNKIFKAIIILCLIISSPCFSDNNFTRTDPQYWLQTFKENQNGDLSPGLKNNEEVVAFNEALKKNTVSLNFLRLGYSRLESEEFKKWIYETILTTLISNKTFKAIDFDLVPRELNELLFKVLKNNTTIEKARIYCNFFEEETLELAKILESDKTLKEIRLSPFEALTIKGKKALREAEDKRNNPGIFSFGKKEPLVILLPNIPDEYLNQNRGRL